MIGYLFHLGIRRAFMQRRTMHSTGMDHDARYDEGSQSLDQDLAGVHSGAAARTGGTRASSLAPRCLAPRCLAPRCLAPRLLRVSIGCSAIAVALLSASVATAQNPVRGVIRPVPGSRPLAIRTPTVGQAPVANMQQGHGHRGGHGRRGGNYYYGPVYNYPGYYNYSGYWPGYYGYPYPVYGYSVSGVGLTVGYTNGNTGISVAFPNQALYYGGYGPYGYVPYRYVPNRFRQLNRFNGGFFSPMSSVDGGFLDSPLLMDRSSASVPSSTERMETGSKALAESNSSESNRSSLIAQRPKLSSSSDRQRALSLVLNADRAAVQGNSDKAMRFSRTAVSTAPELAEAHLRFALALNAIGSFDKAADELKLAVDYKPALANGGFELSECYGNRTEEKQQELDRLANAALESPESAQLKFAIGVLLRMDGQTERGTSILQQVAKDDPTLAPSIAQILEMERHQQQASEEEDPALRLVR